MNSMINLGFIELPQTLVAFANSLSDNELTCINECTIPEDWDGDDQCVINTLKSILYCNMTCKACHYSEHYCSGCNSNPRQ